MIAVASRTYGFALATALNSVCAMVAPFVAVVIAVVAAVFVISAAVFPFTAAVTAASLAAEVTFARCCNLRCTVRTAIIKALCFCRALPTCITVLTTFSVVAIAVKARCASSLLPVISAIMPIAEPTASPIMPIPCATASQLAVSDARFLISAFTSSNISFSSPARCKAPSSCACILRPKSLLRCSSVSFDIAKARFIASVCAAFIALRISLAALLVLPLLAVANWDAALVLSSIPFLKP